MKHLSLEVHSFIRLFIEPLFIAPFPVPDTVLGTGDTAGGKETDKTPSSWSLVSGEDRIPGKNRYHKYISVQARDQSGDNFIGRTVRKGLSEEVTIEQRWTGLRRMSQTNVSRKSFQQKGTGGPQALRQRKPARVCSRKGKRPACLELRKQGDRLIFSSTAISYHVK